MLTLDVKVNGKLIDRISIHNIGGSKGNIYRYEVFRGTELKSLTEEPFATVAHNRERPWWYLVEKVIDVLKSEGGDE